MLEAIKSIDTIELILIYLLVSTILSDLKITFRTNDLELLDVKAFSESGYPISIRINPAHIVAVEKRERLLAMSNHMEPGEYYFVHMPNELVYWISVDDEEFADFMEEGD